MAATVQIVEKNGAGGTQTDKTSGNIRFKNADNATVDTSNPTEITNVKAYMDGANGLGTGVTLYAKAVASYATPAEATGTAGYTDAFTYTSGSPLTLGAGPYSSTGEKADHLVMMLTVGTSASGGITPSETLTLSWDEI